MPSPLPADPQAALERLLAELDPAALARGRALRRPDDPEALLARLTAEVALPLPPPRPRPAPRERVLQLTPVPSRPITLPPRRRPSTEPEPGALLPPPPSAPIAARPPEVSGPPPEIPSLEDFEFPSRPPRPPRPETELAIDDLDILETDDSIGPGGISVEDVLEADVLEADVLASAELGAEQAADLSAETSVGDLDPVLHESTVDRDLKAFFADESVDGSLGDDPRSRSRSGEADDSPSVSGPRSRRDNSLLTNVKKLFKK